VNKPSLGFQIVQLCRSYRAAVGERLAKLGLHPGQEIILMHLWRKDGQTQKQLATSLGVQPPTVTKMLQRLEASGIVERRGSNTDKRSMKAYLTTQGRDLEPLVNAIWQEMESITSTNLSLDQIKVFASILEQVTNNLQQNASSTIC
jgi:MarR family transcriptional regulator, organic hydroperoxide resistance regulator